VLLAVLSLYRETWGRRGGEDHVSPEQILDAVGRMIGDPKYAISLLTAGCDNINTAPLTAALLDHSFEDSTFLTLRFLRIL
jgi:hypothetical protein